MPGDDDSIAKILFPATVIQASMNISIEAMIIFSKPCMCKFSDMWPGLELPVWQLCKLNYNTRVEILNYLWVESEVVA